MRKVININSGWEFVREGLTENVDLPHTWNGIDGQGGADSYYRGKCFYRRMLPECEGRSFVEVTGANTVCEVFVISSLVQYFTPTHLIIVLRTSKVVTCIVVALICIVRNLSQNRNTIL